MNRSFDILSVLNWQKLNGFKVGQLLPQWHCFFMVKESILWHSLLRLSSHASGNVCGLQFTFWQVKHLILCFFISYFAPVPLKVLYWITIYSSALWWHSPRFSIHIQVILYPKISFSCITNASDSFMVKALFHSLRFKALHSPLGFLH